MLDLNDLNQIQGLIAYLNKAFDPQVVGHDLDATVALNNSNGDPVGKLRWAGEVEAYVFEPSS